jgi:hypothetical protein
LQFLGGLLDSLVLLLGGREGLAPHNTLVKSNDLAVLEFDEQIRHEPDQVHLETQLADARVNLFRLQKKKKKKIRNKIMPSVGTSM